MLNKKDYELLEFWAEQTFDDYFDYMTGIKGNKLTKGDFEKVEFNKFFENQLEKLTEEYAAVLLSRIQHCEKLLKSIQDPRLFFILARLYDKYIVEGNLDHLYQRTTRYYAIKAIRADRRHHKAWYLLGQAYSFVALLGGNEKVGIKSIKIVTAGYKSDNVKTGYEIDGAKKTIRFYERAIFCLQQALKISPQNVTYKNELKKHYDERNEAYKYL